MTVVAVSLGILKAVGLQGGGAKYIDFSLRLAVGLSPLVISALWLTLGRGRLGLRLMVAVLLPPLAGAFMGWATVGNPAEEVPHVLAVLTVVLCALSLLVVRQAGYRLVRVSSRQADTDVGDLDSGADELKNGDVHPLDIGRQGDRDHDPRNEEATS